MVVKCNLIENAWFSAYRHFNKSGGVKLPTWPQTLDYTMHNIINSFNKVFIAIAGENIIHLLKEI
jgi:hypothetical protein